MNFKKALLAVIGGLLLGTSIGLVYLFVIQPIQVRGEAEERLQGLAPTPVIISAINTEILPFEGENPLELPTAQKALGMNEMITEPPAFIFGEEGTHLTLYLNFGDQRSREALLLHQDLWEAYIKSGKIQLSIVPVIGGRSYGLYAAEAVAESVALEPDKTWEFLLEILKKGAEVESRDDILNAITNLASQQELFIDAASLNNGTFVSWLLSSTGLPVGSKVPLLALDNTPVDIQLTNEEELKEFLDGV